MANKRQNDIREERHEGKTDPGQGVPARRSESAMSPSSTSHPFGLLRRFANEIDDLFGDFGFGRFPAWDRSGVFASGWGGGWPQIDMFESNGQFVVRADVPGLKKGDLHVEIADDELVIRGERKDEREQKEGQYYRSERTYGRFERRLALPEGTDPDKVSCTFDNGILEIQIKAPEQQTKRSRRVEIQDGGTGGKPEKAA